MDQRVEREKQKNIYSTAKTIFLRGRLIVMLTKKVL